MAGDDQWIDDLKNKTNGEIPSTSRESANKALEETSKSPQTISSMIKEIQALIKDGNNLDTRLFDVQHLVEKANLPSKAKAKTLRDTYVDLLWKSRSIAGTAKAAADDFRGDMLDLVMMDDISAAEKIQELKNWNSLTQQKGQDAVKQPENFSKFTTAVLDYAKIVQKEVSDKESEAKEKLDEYNAKITEIDTKIESLTVNVISPIVKYLKLAGGAFTAILSGSPTTAFEALMNAVKQGIPELKQFSADLQKTQAQREKLYAEKDTIKAQIAQVESQQLVLGDASAVPSTLQSVAEGIKNFSGRMTTFTNSFAQLEKEQRDIQQFLIDKTPVTDPVFSTSVSLLRELLSISSKINDIYAKAPLSN